MAGFDVKQTGPRWTARNGAGGVQSVSLEYPGDFTNTPGETQVVGIDSIKFVFTTVGALLTTRRPFLRLIDNQGNRMLDWLPNLTILGGVNAQNYHFSQGGFADTNVGGGAQMRCMLPSGLWLLQDGAGWHLDIEISGVQAGDSIDEVIIMGRFEG